MSTNKIASLVACLINTDRYYATLLSLLQLLKSRNLGELSIISPENSPCMGRVLLPVQEDFWAETIENGTRLRDLQYVCAALRKPVEPISQSTLLHQFQNEG